MRTLSLLLALWLVFSAAFAETVSLPECTTVEQVMMFLDLPEIDSEGFPQPVGVRKGSLRYIAQAEHEDPRFCPSYWQGGDPGEELDLTLQFNEHHIPYTYHVGVMCTRAVYSMILSYFGIDLTPGGMSALTGQRDLDEPYDEVTALFPSLDRLIIRKHVFATMWENYQSDPACSPVYLYLRKPNGANHALLVVAATGNPREYIVVDPSWHELEGQSIPVYTIVFNKNGNEILQSTFRREMAGSRVKWFYQWKMTETE